MPIRRQRLGKQGLWPFTKKRDPYRTLPRPAKPFKISDDNLVTMKNRIECLVTNYKALEDSVNKYQALSYDKDVHKYLEQVNRSIITLIDKIRDTISLIQYEKLPRYRAGKEPKSFVEKFKTFLNKTKDFLTTEISLNSNYPDSDLSSDIS